MSRTVNKQRPVYLDLQQIQFPATAIASILHRVSGVILFVSIAVLLWLLATSLGSAQGFATVSEIMNSLIAKFVVWGILTALAYHFCGGIRHLLMDMGHFEGSMESGNNSARAAMAITVILSVIAGIWLW
ncbi:succinate dehydrogenase cytochrome b556 subunit [Ferrimonas balearica]|nr:succinate dehydrogenase cytochrome b556 subunit [Ferrimonas balearica]MBW3140320.1 succinate dehydrogenase cytochrome b556 subunit [Ferrimonas balearica]MBW3166335.1 succinate dehydrogenase cytochrome b556 subunit [Ferrimonas balearica]MBY5979796.1 succinate dehydrogenase cytochrome b556 subunit [Ferrimonas balearica]MBY6106571.1 succinate dehydrogenase cytochrome b556 subunit [Ferrimonas balearica]MBY6226446.1 succinate dehydrogenase cytochrome b556 subunit [Ferrimonas balearica]